MDQLNTYYTTSAVGGKQWRQATTHGIDTTSGHYYEKSGRVDYEWTGEVAVGSSHCIIIKLDLQCTEKARAASLSGPGEGAEFELVACYIERLDEGHEHAILVSWYHLGIILGYPACNEMLQKAKDAAQDSGDFSQ